MRDEGQGDAGLPIITEQQAEELHRRGYMSDAGLRSLRVLRRYYNLKAEGKKSGEAILILMGEFNLSDKRIESIVYQRRKISPQNN